MKGYGLFLDDYRIPIDAWQYTQYEPYKTEHWKIVKNYDQFVSYITRNYEKHNTFPSIIGFDHDLAEVDQEIWKSVVGYEGVYEVSNLGNVCRILIKKGTSGGILNLNKNESGLYVYLRNSGNDKKVKVHRLVLESFIGVDKNKPQVNHKDGNRWNNNIMNLEWCRNSENVKHSHDNLQREYTVYGENHNNSKIISKYSKNNNYIDTYGNVNEAGRQEKISFANIAKCGRGERKSAGGFIWKYDNKNITIKSIINHIPKIDKDYSKNFFIPELKEKTGMDCAKWLVDFCIDNELILPDWYGHSMNPVGRENIDVYLRNYRKHEKNN